LWHTAQPDRKSSINKPQTQPKTQTSACGCAKQLFPITSNRKISQTPTRKTSPQTAKANPETSDILNTQDN